MNSPYILMHYLCVNKKQKCGCYSKKEDYKEKTKFYIERLIDIIFSRLYALIFIHF